MSAKEFRRARIEESIPLESGGNATELAPGEYFIEEQCGNVLVHADADGDCQMANVALADFHDWLARRQLVFLSWG